MHIHRMANDTSGSKRLQVSLTQETHVLLGRLAKTGMFGRREPDVAKTLIEEGIRVAFKDGFLKAD
jgi:hypothetical protein